MKTNEYLQKDERPVRFKKTLELDRISFALVSQEERVKDSGNVCCLISELSQFSVANLAIYLTQLSSV